jgi:branched-chain amino acid transport system permease protein
MIIGAALRPCRWGIAIGLPALRLRGINLAIVTLGFAAAFDSVLGTITYPGQTAFLKVAQPAWFKGDYGYFCPGGSGLHHHRRGARVCQPLAARALPGSPVRHSERAAAALGGFPYPRPSFPPFALSAFIAGVSGGLLAGYLGTLVADNFNMMQSLALFAVATMAGAHLTQGAIIGGGAGHALPRTPAPAQPAAGRGQRVLRPRRGAGAFDRRNHRGKPGPVCSARWCPGARGPT